MQRALNQVFFLTISVPLVFGMPYLAHAQSTTATAGTGQAKIDTPSHARRNEVQFPTVDPPPQPFPPGPNQQRRYLSDRTALDWLDGMRKVPDVGVPPPVPDVDVPPPPPPRRVVDFSGASGSQASAYEQAIEASKSNSNQLLNRWKARTADK